MRPYEIAIRHLSNREQESAFSTLQQSAEEAIENGWEDEIGLLMSLYGSKAAESKFVEKDIEGARGHVASYDDLASLFLEKWPNSIEIRVDWAQDLLRIRKEPDRSFNLLKDLAPANKEDSEHVRQYVFLGLQLCAFSAGQIGDDSYIPRLLSAFSPSDSDLLPFLTALEESIEDNPPLPLEDMEELCTNLKLYDGVTEDFLETLKTMNEWE